MARLRQALGARASAAGDRRRGGGQLRAARRCERLCADLGVDLWVPPRELCTDNAAMIAAAARFMEPIAYPGYLSLDASARAA